MKFRTDFVTNSSSSSYCVSIGVDPVGKKSISLDLWPDGEDLECDTCVILRTNLEATLDQIKACTSVDELKILLVDALDFSDRLIGWEVDVTGSNEEFLQTIAEISDDNYSEDDWQYRYAKQVANSLNEFRQSLGEIADLSEIKSVTIKEYFTGCGEFAKDGVDSFMARAIPDYLDWDDEVSVKEALKDRFTESEIDAMIDQVRNDSICLFHASIYTTIELTTGKVTKKYEFKDMT